MTKAKTSHHRPQPKATAAAAAKHKPHHKKAPAARNSDGGVDQQLRDLWIAEAAYFRALARGFAPGDELRDWLEAEAEIDEQLADPSNFVVVVEETLSPQ